MNNFNPYSYVIQLQNEMYAYQSQQLQYQKQINMLQKQINTYKYIENTQKDIQKKIETCTYNKQLCIEDVNTLKIGMEKLEQKLKDAEQIILDKNTEIEQLNNKIIQLSSLAALAEKQSVIETCKLCDELKVTIETNQSAIDRLTNENIQIASNLIKNDNFIQSLKHQLDVMNQVNEQLSRQNASLTRENKVLNQKLSGISNNSKNNNNIKGNKGQNTKDNDQNISITSPAYTKLSKEYQALKLKHKELENKVENIELDTTILYNKSQDLDKLKYDNQELKKELNLAKAECGHALQLYNEKYAERNRLAKDLQEMYHKKNLIEQTYKERLANAEIIASTTYDDALHKMDPDSDNNTALPAIIISESNKFQLTNNGCLVVKPKSMVESECKTNSDCSSVVTSNPIVKSTNTTSTNYENLLMPWRAQRIMNIYSELDHRLIFMKIIAHIKTLYYKLDAIEVIQSTKIKTLEQEISAYKDNLQTCEKMMYNVNLSNFAATQNFCSGYMDACTQLKELLFKQHYFFTRWIEQNQS